MCGALEARWRLLSFDLPLALNRLEGVGKVLGELIESGFVADFGRL